MLALWIPKTKYNNNDLKFTGNFKRTKDLEPYRRSKKAYGREYRLKTKDEDFERIYYEMYRELRDYSWHYLTTKESLEEVLQDTFHDVYVNMNKVLKADSYRAWVYGCLKNNLKQAIRKEITNHSHQIYFNDIENELLDDIDFTEQILDKEFLKNVASKQELQILYMQYVEGYTAAEIAELQHMTEGQCKMRIYRLKKRLKDSLEKSGYYDTKKKE